MKHLILCIRVLSSIQLLNSDSFKYMGWSMYMYLSYYDYFAFYNFLHFIFIFWRNTEPCMDGTHIIQI